MGACTRGGSLAARWHVADCEMPGAFLQVCGVLADDVARQQQLRQIKQQILDDLIQDNNLRQLLQEVDGHFAQNGREAPNWCRLFAGGCGTNVDEEARPIRLRDLNHLQGHPGSERARFCKRYDLDTVTLVSRSLDVLKSIRLVFKRDYLGAFQAEKDDLSRGRLYIRGVERDGEFPRIRFKAEGLQGDQVALKTGYATKRFIGYPGGSMDNKTFVGQMHCNLGNDHNKWAAWECCYTFMAACLRGGWSASSDVCVPRSSSFCIPNPYRGNGLKTWMAGIAVSSQEDCREFMELVLDEQLQREFFEAEYANVVEGVLSQRRRYLDRVRRQREEVDGDDDEEHERRGDDEEERQQVVEPDGDDDHGRDHEHVALEEIGQAIEEGRDEGEGEGRDLLFDADTCLDLFMGMMQNLYFVTTIQLGRHGCGTTTEQAFPAWRLPAAPGADVFERIGKNIMDIVEKYICLERAATCPTLLAPNVGMEVTMEVIPVADGHGRQGGRTARRFKVASPSFDKEQGIRLHLDRRKFRNKPQEWLARGGHRGGHTFKWSDAWGNMSKRDGPVSFKGKLGDEILIDEGGDLDALLELLWPTEGRFGVQAPLLCIYECTYRATSPYSIFQKEKKLLESYLKLSSREPTTMKRRRALQHVCNVMVRLRLLRPHFPTAYPAMLYSVICYKYMRIQLLVLCHAEGGGRGLCAASAW